MYNSEDSWRSSRNVSEQIQRWQTKEQIDIAVDSHTKGTQSEYYPSSEHLQANGRVAN
jgi:hypothetical protein